MLDETLHFAWTPLKVFGVQRMQSLLQQHTEQWYAWVFLWGRFRKPSLEAGRGFTISLMPASNECPCVSEFGRLRAWLNSVFVSLIGLSGWSPTLVLILKLSEKTGWHVQGPNVVQHPVTFFCLFFLCLRAVMLSMRAHASDGLQSDLRWS